nr:MAG TPA: hypothetical protein [Caudoviricetes sp.]
MRISVKLNLQNKLLSRVHSVVKSIMQKVTGH